MKTLLYSVVLMGVTLVATADEKQPGPLVATVKYVELDASGKPLSKIVLVANLPAAGPAIASVTDSSNTRIRMHVERFKERQFSVALRIARLDAEGKERVIADPTLIVVQGHTGNFISGGAIQSHCGVIITTATTKAGTTTDDDPLAEVGQFRVAEESERVRSIPPAKM